MHFFFVLLYASIGSRKEKPLPMYISRVCLYMYLGRQERHSVIYQDGLIFINILCRNLELHRIVEVRTGWLFAFLDWAWTMVGKGWTGPSSGHDEDSSLHTCAQIIQPPWKRFNTVGVLIELL